MVGAFGDGGFHAGVFVDVDNSVGVHSFPRAVVDG